MGKVHTNLKFASLFSGCGGFDLGFIDSGFKSQAAFDLDSAAVLNFSQNIGNEIIRADLTRGIPHADNLRNIDVLIAGPPCQGFSTAGNRDLEDVRNHLLPLTGKLAVSISPKVLVVENVFGALAGAHARYFSQLQSIMESNGYYTEIVRCQTADLGMAQLRRRVLFFAWKTKNMADFTHPSKEPLTLRSVISGVSQLPNHVPKWISLESRDAKIASHIKAGQKFSNVRGGANSVASWEMPSVFAAVTVEEQTILEMLRSLRRQERKRNYGDADPVSFDRLKSALGDPFEQHLDSLVEKGYIREVGSEYDLVGTFNGKYRRLQWDKPSCTVDTRFGSPRYFLHPAINKGRHRGFTVREAARIQGFPDSYKFYGSEQAQYRVIGNAVPPPLGKFAATITRNLLGVS
jgi:DNA (cytosine-5)-methyltransferase 1